MGEQYNAWVRCNGMAAGEASRLRNEIDRFEHRPCFSILLPVPSMGGRWLRRTLDSVLAQIYPFWELRVCCYGPVEESAREVLALYERADDRVKISYGEADACAALNAGLAAATGEFTGQLEPDDELAPEALFEVARLLQEHREAGLVYSDEDEIDPSGNRSLPRFKPGLSPELLTSYDYISRLAVYGTSLVRDIGGFREGFGSAMNYDLVLRLTEKTGRVYRVPNVLYHRRRVGSTSSTPKDEGREQEEARKALREALVRRGEEGSVENGVLPGHHRVRYAVEGEPRVSIIVPTRDNVAMLKRCVESIEERTTYRNHEVLIVDNDSKDRETLDYLASTPYEVLPFREEFNYARINNFAAARASGEYVLFLNDDTEVISPDWLEEMLGHAQRPSIGAVGAKLLYPDGRVQHAGVVLGVGGYWNPGVAAHAFQFYPANFPGHMGRLRTVGNYGAVTAACAMFRKEVFSEVGGFEEALKVGYNDVDLCLKVRALGYRIVYTPYAELYHHESVSRGSHSLRPEETAYMREHWAEELDHDPYYNPNFSSSNGDFNFGADVLRPRSLRDLQGPREDQDLFVHPLLVGQERFSKVLQERYRYARSSRRTTLEPKRGRGR